MYFPFASMTFISFSMLSAFWPLSLPYSRLIDAVQPSFIRISYLPSFSLKGSMSVPFFIKSMICPFFLIVLLYYGQQIYGGLNDSIYNSTYRRRIFPDREPSDPACLVAYTFCITSGSRRYWISSAIVGWAFRSAPGYQVLSLPLSEKKMSPKDRPVLYISNHRSFYDIILTYARVPRACGYISKKSVKKVPSLSTWMMLMNCIFLDRDDLKSGYGYAQKSDQTY